MVYAFCVIDEITVMEFFIWWAPRLMYVPRRETMHRDMDSKKPLARTLGRV
jgi:hypothetical protein